MAESETRASGSSMQISQTRACLLAEIVPLTITQHAFCPLSTLLKINDEPITPQVCVPGLHISLSVFKKHFDGLEGQFFELDKNIQLHLAVDNEQLPETGR